MPASDAADPPDETNTECHSVHVRFAPSQGRRLRRSEPFRAEDGPSLWVERPVLMERVDGTYDLIGTTAHLDALVRWVLSHGADAEVTGPDRLRRRVACEAWRIWTKYTDE
ncbi:MAG: WYL domain-containing protein [Salinibacter sp.]|uniref:WYL domain-containing protein n=1 Tax=Salinibacter sp. TaxID=2065818 RepID=UPI0035D4A27F